jgi:hypothetical protein
MLPKSAQKIFGREGLGQSGGSEKFGGEDGAVSQCAIALTIWTGGT